MVVDKTGKFNYENFTKDLDKEGIKHKETDTGTDIELPDGRHMIVDKETGKITYTGEKPGTGDPDAEFLKKVKRAIANSTNEEGKFDGEKFKQELEKEGIAYEVKDDEVWIKKPSGGYIIVSLQTGEIRTPTIADLDAELEEKVKRAIANSTNEAGEFDGEKFKQELEKEGIKYEVKGNEVWIKKPSGKYIVVSLQTGEMREEEGGTTEDPTAGQYTIKYNANGGTGTMANQTLKLNESKALLANQFEREGYIFGGWSKVENGDKIYNDEQVVTNVTTNKDEEVNLYAVWVATTYAVTYELNGGTLDLDNPTYTTYDTEIIMDNPTKTGYEFAGWTITGMTPTSHKIGDTITSVETISGIKDTSFKNLRNDVGTVTFTAIWTAKTDTPYTVKHYLMDTTGNYPNQNSPTATQNLAGESDKTLTLTDLQQPYTGLQYSYGQVDGNTVTTTTILSNGSRVISLYYTRNRPTINFNGNGTTNPSAITAYYDAPITVKPTKEGHTFVGWFTAASGGIQVEKVPATATTLYAHWTANTYTLTYDGNGGSTPSATTAVYGSNITATSTRTGYTFAGWYTAASGGTQVKTMPVNGGKVYAHWTPTNYTLYYDANGGTVNPNKTTAGYGTTISMPTPTRTGYTFNGWYTAASGGQKAATTMPLNGGTVYAHWTAQTLSGKAVTVGQEVTLGGEQFYVIEANSASSSTVKLLAKYCLNQAKTAQTNVYKSMGDVPFASTAYWSTNNANLNNNSAPSGSAYQLAKSYGTAKGGTGRLLTYSEATSLESSMYNELYGFDIGVEDDDKYYLPNYWLGTSHESSGWDGMVWYVSAYGDTIGRTSGDSEAIILCIRPVVESVSKTKVYYYDGYDNNY